MACKQELIWAALETLAPLSGAEPWDNVGMLLEPAGRSEFSRAFLTIDLNDVTWAEADEQGADLVIAYHPPIFSGLKRLRASAPGERILVQALQKHVTIYSPHTALDAAVGGMNDWLVSALGEGNVRPLVPQFEGAKSGAGRVIELAQPVSLECALARIKAHLGLAHLRLSESPSGGREVHRFAVCPGAGGSVFEKLGQVDLLLTGEMRHHDVLSRAARGTHVILTDHTNTERGFLPLFAEKIRAACPGLTVSVSERDRDPLRVV